MAEPVISETNLVGHRHTTSLAIALINGIKQLNHNKNAYMQSLRPDIRKVARNHILRRNNGLNSKLAKILARETLRALNTGMYKHPGDLEKKHPWIYLVQAAADVSKHRIHIITVSPRHHMIFRPHATTGEQAGTLYMTFNGTFSNIPNSQGIEAEGNLMALHTPQYDAARLGPPSTALTVVKAGSNASSNSMETPFQPLPNRGNNNRRNTTNRRNTAHLASFQTPPSRTSPTRPWLAMTR
jgi:hypothetical protein